MKSLFDETEMKNMKLKNRFVRSATWEGLADEKGYPTEEILDTYRKLADGGIGLIITSYAHITKEYPAAKGMLGIYDDSFIDVYKKLTDDVHKRGSAIMMQIVYGGSSSSIKYPNGEVLGPSAIPDLKTGVVPKEMTQEDIDYIVDSFKNAAIRVKKAGFDGVQIHCAHGFLLSKFLDPYHNRRRDRYGGSIEKSARIIIEVYKAIREAVGDDFHIGIKINSTDGRINGADFGVCRYTVDILDRLGLDSAEISGGNFREFKDEESYYKDYADYISSETNCPILLVGGNRTVKNMNNILNSTDIEYFSLSRPLISEPDLINKYEENNDYIPKCL